MTTKIGNTVIICDEPDKSCVRCKQLDDVPLKVIGQAIKRMSIKKFIERYESVLKKTGLRFAS